MDDRLDFLHTSTPVTAQTNVFCHRQPVDGDVAVQYWSRRDGSSQPPEHLLVFILGNPGLLGYYPPFLNHLHSILPPSFAILSTSHLGHSPYLEAPAKPLSLLEQLQTKVELVQALSSHLEAWANKEDVTRPKLSLIGHSVGAWLSCETAKRLPDVVDGVFMLFPTVGWIAQSWNGRTLWPIFHFPVRQILPLLAPLLWPILPLTWFPLTTLSLLRSPTTIRHVLDLSGSEMETIQEPDLEWFSSQGPTTMHSATDSPDGTATPKRTTNVYGIWSAGAMDGWVGREGQMVRDALGGEEGGRVKVLAGVPHAFCLTQKHSAMVAEALASWLGVGLRHSISGEVDEEPGLANKLPM